MSALTQPSLMGVIYDSLDLLGGMASLCHGAAVYRLQKKLTEHFPMYSSVGLYFGRGSLHFVHRPPSLSVLV